MILLDTNVFSELMRPQADARVKAWILKQKSVDLIISTITIAEIQYGIARLPAGKRQSDLQERFLAFVKEAFRGRIYGFDETAAHLYGAIATNCEKIGNNADAVDLMIAAIAASQKAKIATRNIKDFKGCGVKIINPWK